MGLKSWAIILGLALTSMPLASVAVAAQATKSEKAGDNVVKDGSTVSLQYTLSGEDGKTIETNKGKEPIKYIHGSHQIIPGLEKELTGMKVGGEKQVRVKPEDAYGPINPNGYQEFPKEKVPSNGLKVGAVLMARGPQGQPIPVTVKEIKEKTVVLDLNHPLAGKTLLFDVKVLGIDPPQAAPVPAKPAQPQAQPAKPAPSAPAK